MKLFCIPSTEYILKEKECLWRIKFRDNVKKESYIFVLIQKSKRDGKFYLIIYFYRNL